jgi:hypothetical protein
VLPPVSLVLATKSKSYIEGLTGTRYRGRHDSQEAHDGINRWTAIFASACSRAVADASTFEARIREIQDGWRAALGTVRAGSAVDLLIRALPGAPITTARAAESLTGRTFQAVNEAIARMVSTGILTQRTIGSRNRVFEATEVIDAFTDLERQLASPAGDTRIAPPARRVPYRRRSADVG